MTMKTITLNPTVSLSDLLTLDLIRHPEQFRVFRPGRTIATKGSLSVQLAPESNKVSIYFDCRLVMECPMDEFRPTLLTLRSENTWFYQTFKLGVT